MGAGEDGGISGGVGGKKCSASGWEDDGGVRGACRSKGDP